MTRKMFFMVLAGCLLALCAACSGKKVQVQRSEGEVKEVTESAGHGDASAEYNMGVMYHTGNGVQQDYAKALKWYRMAAAKGEAEAEFKLGVMYLHGQGVEQSRYTAQDWFNKSCLHGSRMGCEQYRLMSKDLW